MKIILYTYNANEEDCIRYDYCTRVDGREHLLAVSAMAGARTNKEIREKAEKLFGADVMIVRGEDCHG
jgi:hypothetical protein